MAKFYPPGTRRGNVTYVVRGEIAGRAYEFRTGARDARAARDAWDCFAAAQMGRAPVFGAPATFAELSARWLDAGERPQRSRRNLARLMPELGELALGEITPADVQAAARRLYPRAKPQTRNRQVIAPAAVVLHWGAANWPRAVPYLRIGKEREAEPATRVPNEAAVEALLARATPDLADLLVLLFGQGWRISEALSLGWDNVRFPERELRVFVSKARRWRVVDMAAPVFAMLAKRKRPDGEQANGARVFPWRTRWGVYRLLRPLCKELGVSFTPHQARHRFATRLADARATSRDILTVGTWNNEKSVARYTAIDRRRGPDILALLDAAAGPARGPGERLVGERHGEKRRA